ncbi:MAG: hypothetical protein SRB1_02512 [Desulfobacteraceae bacterium Eth-SRB1]|nr:MAG: hypothetical protein SRB1_02512 [Desulfobacteraceae bacterium Eth-SRB1]
MRYSTVTRRSWQIFLAIWLLAIVVYLPTAGANGVHFSSPLTSPVYCDYMGTFKIDGVDAQTGDEVAFFDPQGVLCGLYVVDDSGQYGVVHIYGDDTTSEVDEGASPEDVLTIRIWDASENIELTGADLHLSGGSPPSGSSFVTSSVPPVWQDQAGYVLNIDTPAHFAEPVGTPYVCNYIGNLTILGAPADIGDEVAIFDQTGVLCGHVRITTAGQYGIIQVYGDDSETAGDEGAVDGDELTFKVWDKSTGVEYEGGNLLFTPGSPTGSFAASEVPPIWTVDMGYVLDIGAYEYEGNNAPIIDFVSVTQRTDGSGYLDVVFTGTDAENDDVTWYGSYCSYTSGPDYDTYNPLVFVTTDPAHTAFEPMGFSSSGTTYTVVVDASSWPSGDYKIRLKVEDAYDHSNYPLSSQFQLDNTPLEITSSPVITAVEDETYIYMLATNRADVTYTLVDTYPSGMMIDSDGKITYEPSSDVDAGPHTITVKATDKWGLEAIQIFTLIVASVNDAPYFTTVLPETDTCDTLAMPGHVYTFMIEAEDEETQNENLVYTLKGTPPAGMNIKPLDAGYFGARIRWVPGDADAGRTIPLEIEVSDGEKTDTLSYDLRALNPLVITPNSQRLLRINETDVDKDFIISGGFFEGSTPFYSCELINNDTGNITAATTGDYYTFSTVDRTGSYRLKVTDERNFTTISGLIEIREITAVSMTMDVAGQINVAEYEAALTVMDAGTVYNGATVVVPAGSSTDLFTFTCNKVTSDQAKPNTSAVFGDVIDMNARKANGNKVTFGVAIEVTLPYGNIPNIDRPQDLRVYTFNPDLNRWTPVSDYTVNTEDETISFRTTHFSLFTVGQAEELGTPVIGGTNTEDYSMISFPCNPDNFDLVANLSTIFGNYDTRIWRCAVYNNSSMEYDEANASDFADMHPLEPGRAYWVISRYDKLLNVKGLTLNKEVPFETTLHPGWNMVANPYNETINSDAITVSDDGVNFDSLSTTGLTDNYIFKFDPHDDGQGNTIWYTEISLDNASMDPYQGCWIYNYKSSDIIIRFDESSIIALQQNVPLLYKKMIWHARRSLHRFMDVIASTCYADGNSAHQPPPPPGLPGNSSNSIGVADGGGGGCFIATAAYGSKIEPHVRILRDFRDRFLLDNTAGKRFVKFYYTYSPAIAGFIDGHANLQAFVRLSLLPVVGMSWIVLKFGPVTTLVLMFFLIFLIRARWGVRMGRR